MYMVPQPYRPPDGLMFCIGKIDWINRGREYAEMYVLGKGYETCHLERMNDMFLWFPLPTKASWHNARERAESGGTIL